VLENFKIRAKDLPYSIKKETIQSYIGKENMFHHELKILLENIYEDSYVEILQGAEEKGKDIVVRTKNNFGVYEHIAFVVKAFDKLSGSASGKTTEIVIQVQQSFKTKAQLKDIHEEVSISKVYVVNTGTISDGAKRKILALIDEPSYRNNLNYFAMEDLINLFEEHYPEFYFNKDLQTFFKDRIEKIENFLIEDKKLTYFIEPQIKRFNKTKNELLVQQNSENDLKLIGEQLFGHKETFHSFLELITEKKSKKIILTGEAGAGKSVLLFKIILEFINKFLKLNSIKSIEEQSNFSLPVCLKAIDIKNSKLDGFEQIVETFYSSSNDNTIRTIVIDGIDEVSKEDRLKIKEKVEAYIILKDKTITTVFSSRTNFTILEEFEDYIHYELMPYETKQAIEFIKKMASKQSILVENIEKSLLELEGQIPFFPLALRLLVEVVEKHKEIPASITELYNKYIGIMFGEFDISTEIDKLFEPRIKREFLSNLSYEVFFTKNKVKINYQEFKIFLDAFCQKHSFINDKNEFIENIKRISILKIENDEVYFSHKSFLDFFIANYYKDNKEELLDEGSFDKLFSLYSFVEQWEEVVFFYFGLKNKINKSEFKKLKDSINSLENNFDKNLNTFYLGRLVQYAWMTDSDFKKEIISNGMITSLDLKDNFHKIFKESLDMEIPHILSSISMFNMIDLCYSSSFLRNETKILIENIDDNESKLYFATIYILKNSSSLGNEFINKSLKKIVPLIQNTKDLENKVLLTMLIDFFEQKGRIELDDELDKNIDKQIRKYKKRFPEVFKNILTIKKNGFKNLRHELSKR
jgi:hypothetical protein